MPRPRDFQKIAGEFIQHKISPERWLLDTLEALVLTKGDEVTQIRIAQALYFMAPEGGDGS